jgi:NTE family protein
MSRRRIRIRIRSAALALVLTLAAGPAAAAEPAPATKAEPTTAAPVCRQSVPGRPRVALVLSGGGARGAAHAGVLEVLEELRIPIDCIAGTSAGAIVGGLYAVGLTPAETLSVYTDVDWDLTFSDKPSRRIRSFRRKLDDAAYIGALEVGIVGGELRLQSGVIAGQNINTLLKTKTLHASLQRDFDAFAIPFRAVATDMSTGRMVVLKSGDLAQAIRASMSVPAIFAPVEIDGRLLADGGLVRNVPVDVARAMGADVVIAVDVGTPLAGRKDLNDLVGLSVQVINVLTQQNVDASVSSLGPRDVLLHPALGELGSTEFERAGEAAAIGRDAAHAAGAQLGVLSVSGEAWGEYLSRQRRTVARALRIDFLRVAGNSRVPTEQIMARLRTQPGEDIALPAIYRDIERVHAMDDFEQVFFDLIEEGERVGLEIRVREKPWGPNYLKAGIKVADDLDGNSQFSVLLQHLRTNVNHYGAEWRNEIWIGNPRGLATEFYQPLDFNDDWFLATGIRLDSRELNLYTGDLQTSSYQRARVQMNLDVGRQISNFGEVRLGLLRGYVDKELRIGVPVLPAEDEDVGILRLDATVDQLDESYFPTDGFYAKLSLHVADQRLGSSADYDRLSFETGGVLSFGRNTIMGQLALGTGGGDDIPVWDEFTLGGFLSLSGYNYEQLRSDQMFAARVIYYDRVPGMPEVIAEDLFVGASAEAGAVWDFTQTPDASGLKYGGSLFIALNTLLGPIHVAAGLAEGGRKTYYITFGRTF